MSGQEVIPAASQQIVEWDPNSGAQLPAYLAEALDDLGSNIPDRQTVPTLSYEGKTWQIVKDGNKTKLQAPNSDGDMVPVPIMRVVVLNFNADRGRAYYPGTYDPSKTDRPKCWSADGITPDASVAEKVSTDCKTCPMAVKGSKIVGDREMVACSQHRMIAVVPGFEIDGEPLRLKIAVTSDYDKEIVEHGWFAFRQYVDFLKSRGIVHTGLVITKIKFDLQAEYPKLLFALDRVLQPHEIALMREQLKNPKVAELLAEKWTAAGSAGTPIDDSDIRPHGLEGAYADGWQAHPDAPGYSYKGQDVVANAELAARYPAPERAAPPPAPAAPAAAAPSVDPIAAAQADGWAPHPDAPGYHYKGQDVLPDADLRARYGGNSASAPAGPASPAPAVATAPEPTPEPTPAPQPQIDPRAAALADGWLQHPDSAPHGYRDQEVLAWTEIEARYAAGTGSAAPTPAAAEAADAGVVNDPALKALLDQWTQP